MQQRIINILFGVIIVMLTGTVVYLTLGNKSTPVAEQAPAPVETTVKPPVVATDETANWKTYTDSQYGFEVKYPESYSEFHKSGDSSADFRSTDGCETPVNDGGEWPIDCQDYTVSVQQNGIGLAGGLQTKTTIAGFSDQLSTIVQFQKGQNRYVQTFTYNKNQSAVAESTMNKILTSFKFTDPTSDSTTSDWKTYTNEKYGFNFKIPKGYDVSVNSIKYSENGNKYDELVIYDVALQDASIKWQDKNRDPHSGIFPIRATMVCNSDQEFFLNEDVLIENIATKKQILSSRGAVILEAEKSILKIKEMLIKIYKYIDGDTGMQQIAAYWDNNNKMYCTFSPELSQNENLSNQQKQQRISEWEKILSTFEFTK